MIFFRKEIKAHTQFQLNLDEIKHVKARRLPLGASLTFSDGKIYYTHCKMSSQKSVLSDEICSLEPILYQRILLTSIPEGKRWDWLIQKATELGVTQIYPLVWKRSSRKNINIERSQKIIQEASAQCLRLDLPILHEVSTLIDLVKKSVIQNRMKNFVESDKLILLDPQASLSFYETCKPSDKNLSFLIGPEGGLEPDELKMITGVFTNKAKLGNRILRIETAAVAVLASTLAGVSLVKEY